MATAPTLYWYQGLDTGTLMPTYFGQLDATVAELCSENAVTAPTAKWWNPIACQLVSQWAMQTDTAVRALCTALSVTAPIPLILGSNTGQYQSEYAESLDGVVRALCAVYHADAVHFDGSTFLSRVSLIAPNSPDFSMSFWANVTNDEDSGVSLWASDPSGNYITYGDVSINGSDAKFRTNLSDDTGLSTITINGSAAALRPIGSWQHYLLSVNTNHDVGEKIVALFVNDVDAVGGITDGGNAFDIVLNALPFFFGSDGGPGFLVDIADAWIALGQSLLTGSTITEATRRKFIDASGKPVDLGADGSTPTGVSPTIFFSGDATGFATNKGTGGAFTLTGSLTNASTSPSD